MISDSFQHIAQLEFSGVQVIEFGIAKQAVDGCCALAAGIWACKEIILTSQGDDAQYPLSG
jgi:hypothetical protein